MCYIYIYINLFIYIHAVITSQYFTILYIPGKIKFSNYQAPKFLPYLKGFPCWSDPYNGVYSSRCKNNLQSSDKAVQIQCKYICNGAIKITIVQDEIEKVSLIIGGGEFTTSKPSKWTFLWYATTRANRLVICQVDIAFNFLCSFVNILSSK